MDSNYTFLKDAIQKENANFKKNDESRNIECVTCSKLIECKISPRKLRGCLEYEERKRNV